MPRLLRLRSDLLRRITDLRPRVFVGVDAPDFNLGLEEKLRARGIRVVGGALILVGIHLANRPTA